MAQVTHLRSHQPSGLSDLAGITEEDLFPDPKAEKRCSWTVTPNVPGEQLLVTPTAVVWTQGDIVRRVFRFDIEKKEPVIQALLTWFPSEDPADALLPLEEDETMEQSYFVGASRDNSKRKHHSDSNFNTINHKQGKRRLTSWNSKVPTYGSQLGSFPKPRAYERMMEGSSEDEEDRIPQGRARALVVILKSQAYVYFQSGRSYSVHMPYEVKHALPAPRGLLLQIQAPVNDELSTASFLRSVGQGYSTSEPAPRRMLPLIYSLTDPLSEFGLLVTKNGATLDSDEEIIFISQNSELGPLIQPLDHSKGKSFRCSEVMFAVTRNAHKGQITLWYARYIPQEPSEKEGATNRRRSSTGTSRRRSSFGPTGSSTPTASGGPGSIPLSGSLSSSQASDDFVAEFTDKPARRASRRISSLVSRSDLSQSSERHLFSDMASAGSSFAQFDRSTLILDDVHMDDSLDDLNMAGLGLESEAQEGIRLRNEVSFHKIESFPFASPTPGPSNQKRHSMRHESVGTLGSDDLPRVFTMLAPVTVQARDMKAYGQASQKILLCVVNKLERQLSIYSFVLKSHIVSTTSPHSYTSASAYSKRKVTTGEGKLYTPVMTDIVVKKDVLDAIKTSEGGITRILILQANGDLILHSPWSPDIKLNLPSFSSISSPLAPKDKNEDRSSSNRNSKIVALNFYDDTGRVTLIDEELRGQKISIQMAPKDSVVRLCLETVKTVMGAMGGVIVGETLGVLWMAISKAALSGEETTSQRRRVTSSSAPKIIHNRLDEWREFVIAVICLAIPDLQDKGSEKHKRHRPFARTSSVMNDRAWEEMLQDEGKWGAGPEYLRSPAWEWMVEETDNFTLQKSGSDHPITASPSSKPKTVVHSPVARPKSPPQPFRNTFITDCVADARNFLQTAEGQKLRTNFPNTSKDSEYRRGALAIILKALHLVREELKLDISMEPAMRRITPLLAQLAKWVGWREWAEYYANEDIEMENWAFDECKCPPSGQE